MIYRLATIFAAYILDLLIGDPQHNWHPVRIIGRLIAKLETILNNCRLNKKFAGFLLVLLVVGITAISVAAMLKLSRLIHPAFYFIVCVLLIYFALAAKSLAQEANKVYEAIKEGDIARARKSLSMIVARDTERLDEPEIIRATVETVAESTMDGIISPLFYAFLGGPVLVWVYKAINTLDSMVGYKNQRFARFGMLSAKIDGFANFIPSKITCLAILSAGLCCGKFKSICGQWVAKYFLKGERYNSEATEAVMASVLGVRLGGVNFYNSLAVQKNLIGENFYPLEIKHIREGIKIAYLSSGLCVAIGTLFICLIGRR